MLVLLGGFWLHDPHRHQFIDVPLPDLFAGLGREYIEAHPFVGNLLLFLQLLSFGEIDIEFVIIFLPDEISGGDLLAMTPHPSFNLLQACRVLR